jgi:hypothetical protein
VVGGVAAVGPLLAAGAVVGGVDCVAVGAAVAAGVAEGAVTAIAAVPPATPITANDAATRRARHDRRHRAIHAFMSNLRGGRRHHPNAGVHGFDSGPGR